MCKICGALCILFGCTYLGLIISGIYKKRKELFCFLQNGLTMLETEINYTATPLPLALEKIAGKSNLLCRPLFKQAAYLLQTRKAATAGEAWSEGIAALKAEVPLTREESELLQLFGQGLGASAKDEQLKQIALAKNQLAAVQKEAEEERAKKQKLWQYLGFSLGAVLVLLLI